jgi:hypothetical protein
VGPRRPMWAAETELVQRLEAEWKVIAGSRWLRDRLQAWAVEDDRLAFDDGEQLVAAAQRRDVSSWGERDLVLTALLERANGDVLARRVALQVVLPGLKSLIDGVRAWDVEERAALVVATAVEVLAWCASEPAGTPPSFRVYVNTRRRVLRSAARHRAEPVVYVDDYSPVEHINHTPFDSCETEQIDGLVAWVERHGRVRTDAARLVVMTRAGGVSVDELAAAQGVDPQTLRQRRLRTERRVRQSPALAR